MRAAARARSRSDPWEEFHIRDRPAERVVRHKFDAARGVWTKTPSLVKVESESFAEGAMRRCFRCIKLSQQPNRALRMDWEHASHYVVKEYKNPVSPTLYFDDALMQGVAHYWAGRFSARSPPKRVDVLEAQVFEFVDRPGCPLMCAERNLSDVAGGYRKYMNNTGWVLVEDGVTRFTPQAFAHFSFVASGGRVLVADVQGVGDLYTDPQIHTLSADGFGEGNLGARGMALFFSSHICNPVCHALGLPPVVFEPSEAADVAAELEEARQAARADGAAVPAVAGTAAVSDGRAPRRLPLRVRAGLDARTERRQAKASASAGGRLAGAGPGASAGASAGTDADADTPTGLAHDAQAAADADADGELGCCPPPVPSGYLFYEDSDRPTPHALGRVHESLAALHAESRISDPPNAAAWVFHVRAAAACGDRIAMYRLAAAVETGHAPGVEDLPLQACPDAALPLYRVAARLGGCCAARRAASRLLEAPATAAAVCRLPPQVEAVEGVPVAAAVVEAAAAVGEDAAWAEAEALLAPFIKSGDWKTESDAERLVMIEDVNHRPDRCVAALARAVGTGGHGLEANPERAAELLDTASEMAMELGLMKVANTYMMRAEEMRG